jgi:hypothetical protein
MAWHHRLPRSPALSPPCSGKTSTVITRVHLTIFRWCTWGEKETLITKFWILPWWQSTRLSEPSLAPASMSSTTSTETTRHCTTWSKGTKTRCLLLPRTPCLTQTPLGWQPFQSMSWVGQFGHTITREATPYSSLCRLKGHSCFLSLVWRRYGIGTLC